MQDKEYKALVNSKSEFTITKEDLLQLDIIQNGEQSYHLIYENKSYQVELANVNLQEKRITFKLDDEQFDIQLEDQYDALIQKMGFNKSAGNDSKKMSAPMPGIVLDVLKKEGDIIEKGENVLILEAMKMENVLKAPSDGTIAKIEVSKGEAVDKGQMLIVME